MAVVAGLLLGSGLCALIYQTVWLRAFRLIVGSSTAATATVLATFLGGLGLGSLVLGPRAQRSPNPLRFYGRLELLVALSAALTPALLELAGAVYWSSGGSAELGNVSAVGLRAGLAAAVMALPVFLMGGTLPAAARAALDPRDVGRRGLGVLYGVNTLGAVVGALVSTFVLFEVWGTARTLWAACGLNLLVAGLALRLARTAPPPTESAPQAGSRAGSRGWILAAAGVSGFCFLLAELVWYRLAAPILGGSTYTFGLVLATALLGIGLGGALYAIRGPRRATPARFAQTCALMTLTLAFPLALGDDLALLAEGLRTLGRGQFVSLAVGWALVTGVLAFLPAFVAGYQFPLLLALAGRGTEGVATDVGRVYAANTLGSIVGALAGGFGLIPILGAVGAWRLAALAFVPLALRFACAGAREPSRRRATLAVAALGVLLCLASGPSAVWRHSGIGAGRSSFLQPTWNAQRAQLNTSRRAIVEEVDGVESGLGISAAAGLSLLVNGKSDGSATGDAPTTVLLGLFGALVHPNPERAFVIGLASGQTAGWLADVPSMAHVDCVELEPRVADYARRCETSNRGAMTHPKIRHLDGDGREALLTAKGRYDLIASEPSNPFRAGIAGFYTHEFYEQVRAHLKPGGLLLQWMQVYEVDAGTLQILFATLTRVFPHVSLWVLRAHGDLLLMASEDPQVIDVTRIRERLRHEVYATGLGRIAGIFDAEGVLAYHIASPRLPRLLTGVAGSRLNTDDRTLLEYRFARLVGSPSRVGTAELIESARLAAALRPEVRGRVDWGRVDLLRERPFQLSLLPGTGAAAPALGLDLPAEEARRSAVWRSLFTRGGAALSPEFAPREHDLFERTAVALARAAHVASVAERGAQALELDRLEADGRASDAAWIRVVACVTDRRDEELLDLATRAFAASRRDPWVWIASATAGLQALQGGLNDADPELRGAVGRALLKAPFSHSAAEFSRQAIALRLTFSAGDFEAATRALELAEPHPEWAREALEMRAECYRRLRPQRYAQALEDLEAYRAHESPSVIELLKTRR